MTYALIVYFFIAGEMQRRELAAGLTYQQCRMDAAALAPSPAMRIACETEA